MSQHRYVILSGFLGATASCLAKIALSSAVVSNDDDAHMITPAQYMYQTCQAQIKPSYRHQDLDTVLLGMVYWVLGELAVKCGIRLVRYWHIILDGLAEIGLFLNLFEIDWCHATLLVPRAGGMIAVVVLNGLMIAYFVKGIQESGSVAGPALSSAMNFLCSAVYGYLLWGESFSESWWMGFASVLLGVMVLSTVPATMTTEVATKSPSSPWFAMSTSNASSSSSSSRSLVAERIRAAKAASVAHQNPAYYGQSHLASTGKYRYEKTNTTITKFPINNDDKEGNGSSSSMKLLTKPVVPKKKKKQIVIKKPTGLIDRTFVNECILCDGELFEDGTGQSLVAVADLSPACFHIFHSKCLKQQSASDSPTTSKTNKAAAGCPVCCKSINMWISAKQAAHFAGFWMERVEKILIQLGPVQDTDKGPQPVPAQVVRDTLRQDGTLTEEQLRYIDDDPTGLGKGLQSALEWGGYVDFNSSGSRHGHVGWSAYLRSRGIWSYNLKKDDLWLWQWGTIHPRQRCEGCQFLKRPLPIQCPGCAGSSECAYYCSASCQKRDWQRHKLMCETWQRCVPAEARKK